MVYVVITSWWPLSKMQEVTDVYNKQLQELGTPDFLKSAQLWGKPSKKGAKAVTFNEIEEGKLEEALQHLGNFMSGFVSVEGYTYKLDLWYSQAEMLAAQQG